MGPHLSLNTYEKTKDVLMIHQYVFLVRASLRPRLAYVSLYSAVGAMLSNLPFFSFTKNG